MKKGTLYVSTDVRRTRAMDFSKVTCGETAVSIILNALEFVSNSLYLSTKFMATKPVEMLIREGPKSENFNDDVLRRTLNKLYRVGTEEIFIKHGDLDAVPIQITYRALKGKQTRPEAICHFPFYMGKFTSFYTSS